MQSLIGLTLLVPEIIRGGGGGVLKTFPLNGKKAWPE